jgi:Terminase RNaseH-like domain
VLADCSGQYEPTAWAHAAVRLYRELRADRIIAETNYGGGMVESVIRAVDPNISYRSVTASRGKVARAEPIAALYEQNKVHHLGSFPELEDQMSGFTSNFDRARAGYSPGRVDALVWALSDLMATAMPSYAYYEIARRRAGGESLQQIAGDMTGRLIEIHASAYAAAQTGRNPFGVDQGLKRLVVENRDGAFSGDRRLGPTGPLAPSYAVGSLEYQQQLKKEEK